MTKEQLKHAIMTLNDAGSAQVFAGELLKLNDTDLNNLFIKKVLEKAAGDHHQTALLAIAALKVINGR